MATPCHTPVQNNSFKKIQSVKNDATKKRESSISQAAPLGTLWSRHLFTENHFLPFSVFCFITHRLTSHHGVT
jgi:hypothetical protein